MVYLVVMFLNDGTVKEKTFACLTEATAFKAGLTYKDCQLAFLDLR